MALIRTGFKDLLVAAGVGSYSSGAQTADWSIFYDVLPDKPDRCIVIRETGGLASNPRWLLDYPSFQLRVRGKHGESSVVRQKVQDILDVLTGLPSQTISGDRWVAVNNFGGIIAMASDQNERPSYVTNFRLIIEPASNALTNRQAI